MNFYWVVKSTIVDSPNRYYPNTLVVPVLKFLNSLRIYGTLNTVVNRHKTFNNFQEKNK